MKDSSNQYHPFSFLFLSFCYPLPFAIPSFAFPFSVLSTICIIITKSIFIFIPGDFQAESSSWLDSDTQLTRTHSRTRPKQYGTDKCSDRSMEVQLPARLGDCDRPVDLDQPTHWHLSLIIYHLSLMTVVPNEIFFNVSYKCPINAKANILIRKSFNLNNLNM